MISRSSDRGTSRFSRTEVPYMPWFFDRAGPCGVLRIASPPVLPSVFKTTWAPRMPNFAAQ